MSGRTNPLYDTLSRPGNDFTLGALPFLYQPAVIDVEACTIVAVSGSVTSEGRHLLLKRIQ